MALRKTTRHKERNCKNAARFAGFMVLCTTLFSCTTMLDYQRSFLQAARYQTAGDHVRAEEFHRLALQQAQASRYGVSNPSLALQMSNLASVLYLQDASGPEILSLMEEALRLINLEQNPAAEMLSSILSNHGLAMVWNDRLQEAEADCQRLEGLEGTVEYPNVLRSRILYCHATTSLLKRDFATADAAFLESQLALRQHEHPVAIQTIRSRAERRYLELKARYQTSAEPLATP